MSNRLEASIRDHLFDNLNLIEAGLKPLEKEFHLPNCLGSRGYVDILAMDEQDRHVVIELKRSNQTARQALHEINKYVALLKHNFGCKDYEIRCIIVSTDWLDLLMPFSEMVYNSQLNLTGYELILENDTPVYSRRIEPIKYDFRREFGVYHKIFYFRTNTNLANKRQLLIGALRKLGIKDFVIITAHIPTKNQARTIRYPWMFYLAPQNYGALHLMELLYQVEDIGNLEEDDEFAFIINDFAAAKEVHNTSHDEMSELVIEKLDGMLSFRRRNDLDGRGYLLERLIWNLDFVGEDFDTSCPDRFSQILDNEGWEIRDLEFGGLFQDPRLRKGLLDREIRGYEGGSRLKYRNFASSDQPDKIREIKRNVRNCLESAPEWKLTIEDFFEDLKDNHKPFRMSLLIYNPNPIWLSLEQLILSEKWELYIPAFEILIDFYKDEQILVANGWMAWNQVVAPKPEESLKDMAWRSKAFRNHDNDQVFMKHFGLQRHSARYLLQQGEPAPIQPQYSLLEFREVHLEQLFAIYEFVEKRHVSI